MKKLKPIIIYNDGFLNYFSWAFDIAGISLFPFIILKTKYKNGISYFIKKGKETINHETIHFQQALELFVIPFYILYILEWILKLPFYGKKAYYNISFEKEAYNNEKKFNYIKNRKRYNWLKLIIQ